jgi:hypothetical protein
MSIISPFMEALSQIWDHGAVPDWAWKITPHHSGERMVIIRREELRQRFGPMTDEQAQAIRQEIKQRMVTNYDHNIHCEAPNG